MRAIRKRVCATALLAVAVAGCGGQRHAGDLRQSARSDDALTSVAPPRLLSSLQLHTPIWLQGAAVGQPQGVTARGASLEVNVQGVVDPLRRSGATPPAGSRAVAIDAQIRNLGPATYNSSATGDFTVVASRGPVMPLMVPSGSCKTPVNDFDREITAGEDRVGCVAFSVPRGARLEAVIFAPYAQAAGELRWRP